MLDSAELVHMTRTPGAFWNGRPHVVRPAGRGPGQPE
jgi:hypothetical protein